MIVGFNELEEAITNEKIIIIKSNFIDNIITEQKCNSSDLNKSHKIKLHAGCLIRTLSHKRWLDPKTLYDNRDGIIDLRNTKNRIYKMKPGESVIIYTNEFIETSSDYFGLILSKVRYENTGLIISSTYIDPNWNGILQLVVTNNSEKSVALKENCEIANLIFLKTAEKIQSNFGDDNGHYTLTWVKLFENPVLYPKWDVRNRNLPRKIFHKIYTYWKIFLATLSVAIVIALLTFLLKLFDVFTK